MLSPEQEYALSRMLAGANVFLTGRGGTGKSVVINEFFQRAQRRVICLAPTGFAARNLHSASTIHSFFHIAPEGIATVKEKDIPVLIRLFSTVDTLVVDEISMVRADIWEVMDQTLRRCSSPPFCRLPFAGKQIIAAGDFFQLPPVCEEELYPFFIRKYGGVYAFCTTAWQSLSFENIFLEQIHRQKDPLFLTMLESIRTQGSDIGNWFEFSRRRVKNHFPDDCMETVLCCRRKEAEKINSLVMWQLADPGFIYAGNIHGSFPEYELPTERNLEVKLGAKMIVLANRNLPGAFAGNHFEYVNGDIGTVIDYRPDISQVTLQLQREATATVSPYRWGNYVYEIGQKENGEDFIVSREVGCFVQLPLAPAYAMTVHKAQGQTLFRMHLVLGDYPLSYGQLYTALSRVRSIEDFTLNRPFRLSDVQVDPQVTDFYRRTFLFLP